MHLRLQNITRLFSGIKALDGISLEIYPGEVHAICGENGAGKSTLMHLIAGNQQPDSGAFFLDGTPVVFAKPADSIERGVGIVHQEKSISAALSVAENIFPDRQPRNRFGFIDLKRLHKQAAGLLRQLGLPDINPSIPAGMLSSAQQQMIEIAKSLAVKPRLWILDEPTASLTQQETAILFRIILDLKQSGVAIIYISHRMAEIGVIADRITVLKDGKCQGSFPAGEICEDRLIRLMIGREIKQTSYRSTVRKDIALGLHGLSGERFSDISLELHKGEIFGLAGLDGSGKGDLARAIFGAGRIQTGQIKLQGIAVSIRTPAEAVKNGIVYLPEERKSLAVYPQLSVMENMLAGMAGRPSSCGFINKKEMRRMLAGNKTALGIKMSSLDQEIQTLSGGNQQKTILARCLSTGPDILIAHEPTQGVDIGSKKDIYDLLKHLTTEGKSILLISGELSELLLLCDRIGVMRMGKLVAILSKEEATEEILMRFAAL
ncbi:sugar ABC transporter ATP-binding protein [Flavitalea flava]